MINIVGWTHDREIGATYSRDRKRVDGGGYERTFR